MAFNAPVVSMINAAKTEQLLETTFGIELELIVVHRNPPKRSSLQSKDLEAPHASADDEADNWDIGQTTPGQKAIFNAIRAFSRWRRQEENGCRYRRVAIYDPAEECATNDYRKWQLTTDGSLRLNPGERKAMNKYREDWEGVEIISRVFRASRDDWEGELRTVLDAVLSLNGPNRQVLVNSKCGLHVHVGNGNAGVPLATQQKAMKLVAAFERQIDCLHAASRFDDDAADADNNEYNGVYNAGPAMAFKSQGHTVRSGMAAIDRCATAPDLAGHMSAGTSKRCAYNLHNRIQRAAGHSSNSNENDNDTSVRTVEFRQHRGTLDYAEIRAWVLFTTGLLRFAHETPAAAISALVERRFPDEKYNHLRFLRDLGMHSEKVVRYYSRKCKARSIEAEMRRSAQPGQAPRPLNERLLKCVNGTYVKDNSWAVVRATVAARLAQGLYGLRSSELGIGAEGLDAASAAVKVPVWLKGACKGK